MSRQLHFSDSIFFLAITLISQLGHSGIEGEDFRVELVKTGNERNGEFFPALDKTLATAIDNNTAVAHGSSYDTYAVNVHNFTGHPAIGILQTGSDHTRAYLTLNKGLTRIERSTHEDESSRFLMIGKEEADKTHSGPESVAFHSQSDYILVCIIGLLKTKIDIKSRDTHLHSPEQHYAGSYPSQGNPPQTTGMDFSSYSRGVRSCTGLFSGHINSPTPIEINEVQSPMTTSKSTLGNSQSGVRYSDFNLEDKIKTDEKWNAIAHNIQVYKRAFRIIVDKNIEPNEAPPLNADELTVGEMTKFLINDTKATLEKGASENRTYLPPKKNDKYDFNR